MGWEPDADRPGGRMFSDDFRARLPEELQIASYLADEAVDFIAEHRGEPFVLYVSFLEPHPPFYGPLDHLYDPDTLPVESGVPEEAGGPLPLQSDQGRLLHAVGVQRRPRRADQGGVGGAARPVQRAAHLRRSRHLHRGRLATAFGRATWRTSRSSTNAVGRIVRAIEASGQRDRTVLVFTSEHGELVGTHGMLEMRTFYDHASRVPMLIRVPWIPGRGPGP